MSKSENSGVGIRSLLEPVKPVLRPLYRPLKRIVNRRASDSASAIAIESFGGFEVAFRKGTADELVIGHSFDNDIFFSGFPEYQPAEDDVIVDVGARIGHFSLLAAAQGG